MTRNVSLTLGQSVVDTETAHNFVDVAGVEKSVSPHHHLESLWANKERHLMFKISWHESQNKIGFYLPLQTTNIGHVTGSQWEIMCCQDEYIFSVFISVISSMQSMY